MALFAEELRFLTGEEGAKAVFSWLESGFSNVIRVSDLRPLVVQDAAQAVDALYQDHVERQKIVGRSA